VFYLSIGLKLNPIVSSIAMSFSSIFVVTNALRLRKFKPTFEGKYHYEVKQTTLDTPKPIQKTIHIEGMMCNHCVSTVTKALTSIEGVIAVRVSLEDKCAYVTLSKLVEDDILSKAITEEDFTVTSIEHM
jgi:Cu+-exporting ATPase